MSRACHSQSAVVSGPAKIPVFSRYLTHVSQPISARYGNARILSLVACSLMQSANQYFSSSLLGVEGKAAGRFLIFCSVETAAIFQIVISLNSFWRVWLWKFFRRIFFFEELSFFQFLVRVRMYTLRSLLPDEHSQLHVTRCNFTFTRCDQFNHYKMMHRKFVSIYFSFWAIRPFDFLIQSRRKEVVWTFPNLLLSFWRGEPAPLTVSECPLQFATVRYSGPRITTKRSWSAGSRYARVCVCARARVCVRAFVRFLWHFRGVMCSGFPFPRTAAQARQLQVFQATLTVARLALEQGLSVDLLGVWLMTLVTRDPRQVITAVLSWPWRKTLVVAIVAPLAVAWKSVVRPKRIGGKALNPFLTGRMFVRRTYFGHFDELWFVS